MKCAAGLTPIKLFLDERHVRAWPGGVGDCKVGSNYAPTIHPQITAHETHGTPQVCPPARAQPQPHSVFAAAVSGEALQAQHLLRAQAACPGLHCADVQARGPCVKNKGCHARGLPGVHCLTPIMLRFQECVPRGHARHSAQTYHCALPAGALHHAQQQQQQQG